MNMKTRIRGQTLLTGPRAGRLLATIALCSLLPLSVVNVSAAAHYVDVNSTNATLPYVSWATAATNIQDAVDAAVSGDEIVVTNGTYATGGRTIDVFATNRVVVDKPLSLRSINGPLFTIINGGHSNRCVYLTNGASLSGFTLTNGRAHQGGGLWCESINVVVSNCVVSRNSTFGQYLHTSCCDPHVAPAFAGGVYGGTLNNCILSDNWAETYTHVALRCDRSTCNATLNNCRLTGNSAGYGGGAYGCTLNNCTLSGNYANGVYISNDCGDFSVIGGYGGGAFYCTLNNCIAYFNTSQQGANYDSSSTLNYSCTIPLPTNGVGNITSEPGFADFVGGNLRLQPDSPCVNAGYNAFVQTASDLDGNPRVVDGTVDIGAYEFRITPTISFGRLLLLVNDADLEGRNKQPLLATLSAAMSSFERGNLTAALNQLSAFQNKARGQIASWNPALAGELIAAAQRISHVVSGRESK